MDPLSDFLNTEEKDEETSKVYIGSGLSCLHGATYQLKLLMLFLFRAIHKGYNFNLAAEIEAADKFDDVVFRFMENDENVHIFVQAKHKQDETKQIKIDDLINKRGKAEYYLPKYFISYLKIKHNSDFAGSILRDFILCTNIDLDLDPSTAGDEVKRLGVHSSASNQINEMFVVAVEGNDDFFGDGGTKYRFCYDNNDMISVLKHTFEEALKEEMKELKKSTGRLQGKKLNQIRQWLSEFENITSGNVEEEIKAFFDSLVLAVGQPNETDLTQIMKNELSQEFNTFNSNYVYARFQEVMLDWLKDRRGYFLTQDDGSKLFEKLRVELHGDFLFNVQSPVESFFGRDEELKTLHNLINQGGPAVICQQTSISGLGGIGKTELVRKYVSIYGQHYDHNILWIEAETHETLKASFIELARVVLGVAVKDLDIKSVLRETYNFFARRRCLFIFDNANAFRTELNSTGISDYLPTSFLPRGTNTPKVLITSRNQSWGRIPQLVLKTFEEQEALDFIKIELKIEDESQDADIRHLAEILQYFPLALQQAIAYVKQKSRALKNIGSDFKIINYISRYKTETKNLLDFNFPKDTQDSYTKTTYTIMKITIDRIKENKEFGEQAGHILDIISLLAPDNIPVEMFLKLDLIQYNEETLGSAIELLKQYSLINSGQVITQLNVHRLVQQVTRIILKDHDQEINTFKNAISLLKEMFIKTNNLKNHASTRQLLSHSQSFLSHLDSWLETHPTNKPTVDSYFLELLPILTKGYYELGNFTRQKKIQERALAILQKQYGNDHIIITLPLLTLGFACGTLGNPKKHKELLERALEIQEKHYGRNNFQIAVTLRSLGEANCALGNPQQQKELLEKALEIEENHYGKNHIEVAVTLAKLGKAYGDLGDPKTKKELLERVLEIKENHYGRKHVEVAVTLSCLGNTYGTLGNPQKQKELLQEALEIKENHYGRNNFDNAVTLVNLGNAYGALGNPQKQKELLEQALEIRENHYGKNHFQVAVTLAKLGKVYNSLGIPKKQKELLEQALKIQENHYGKNNFKVAVTLSSLGGAYGALGDPQKQKELLEHALEIQENHFGRNHFEVAVTLAKLGKVYGVLGNQKIQKELLERALEIKENHYGKNHFEIVLTLDKLGRAHGILGNLKKQKELLERALEIREKHYGKNNTEVAATLVNLSKAYGALGDSLKQIELLQKALDIKENHYGKNHIKVAVALSSLGDAYGALGDAEKQTEFLEHALYIKENHYGKNHFEVAVTLVNLSHAYGALGDSLKQVELLQKALKIKENHYGKNHFKVAVTLSSLADAYGALGDPEKQKELLEKALEIKEKHYGKDHFEVGVTLAKLGKAFGDQGDLQKQKVFLERALEMKESHYGRNHIKVAVTISSLGQAYGVLGDPKKQIEILQRALKIKENHYGKHHFKVAETLGSLGDAYGALGDLQKQKELVEQALEIEKMHYSRRFILK